MKNWIIWLSFFINQTGTKFNKAEVNVLWLSILQPTLYINKRSFLQDAIYKLLQFKTICICHLPL